MDHNSFRRRKGVCAREEDRLCRTSINERLGEGHGFYVTFVSVYIWSKVTNLEVWKGKIVMSSHKENFLWPLLKVLFVESGKAKRYPSPRQEIHLVQYRIEKECLSERDLTNKRRSNVVFSLR